MSRGLLLVTDIEYRTVGYISEKFQNVTTCHVSDIQD